MVTRNPDDALLARAEREFDRRSLEKIASAITDPDLRDQARQLATGTMSAGDFVRGLDRSSVALRGLDRYLNRYIRLSEEDLHAAFAHRDAEISSITSELSAEHTKPEPTQPVDRQAQALDEEETWESHSWLE